jgi:5-methylcytosine-specific restriction endonuclease McrA
MTAREIDSGGSAERPEGPPSACLSRWRRMIWQSQQLRGGGHVVLVAMALAELADDTLTCSPSLDELHDMVQMGGIPQGAEHPGPLRLPRRRPRRRGSPRRDPPRLPDRGPMSRTCLHCNELVESNKKCACIERRRQRATKKQRGYPRGWDRISRRLRSVQRFCSYCHASGPSARLTVDHVHPLSLGGSNNLDNLTVACVRCNASKRDRMPTEHELTAAGVPVQLQLEGVRGGVAPRADRRRNPVPQSASRSLKLAGWPAQRPGHGRVSA